MSAYPKGSITGESRAQVNRVSKLTDKDAVEVDPDLLTLAKRKVNTMDLLEVSDNAAWAILVAGLSNDLHKKLFQVGNTDRLRYRYKAYGWDRTAIQLLHDALP